MTQEEIYLSILTGSDNRRLENQAIEHLYKLYYAQAKRIVLRHGLAAEDSECLFNDAIIELVYRIKDNTWVWQEDGLKRFILRFIKFKSLSLARQRAKMSNNLPYDLQSELEELPALDEEKLIEKILEIAARSKNGVELIEKRFLKKLSYAELSAALGITPFSCKNSIFRIIKKIRKENLKLDDYFIQ